MNKKLLISAAALIVSTSTFAGGILTNTNQNATFLRNPARDAVIAIDGVYSNPAGIAFLPEGFHFSLSWQAAWQKREITSKMPFYALNTAAPGITSKEFTGEAIAPVIPSFQTAYVFNDKWSVSAQFAIGGGGGKCEFDNGLPMFEKLVGGNLVSAGATSYGLTQNLTGEQYFYALQLGGTYKITDKISVFGGVRGVLANCSYTGAIANIKANGIPGTTFLNGVVGVLQTQIQNATLAGAPQATIDQLTAAAQTAGTYAYLMQSDFNLDCSQEGLGITPIIGVDVNLGKWNLAAKYEFRTKIELENESANTPNVDAMMPTYANGAKVRSDIPALFTIGAQYSPIEAVRLNGGFHLYFDKDAKGTPIKEGKNTWEASIGAETDLDENWTASFGFQRTQYGFDDADMSDTNFNNSNFSLGFGGAYKVNDLLKINFGYYHTFYDEHEVTSATGVDVYNRKNDVVGVSLDFKF
ncbi:MAG: transporter [Bacteroidaceae bacterium]|nr:transporter [Bacteroidaceae bacterium]